MPAPSLRPAATAGIKGPVVLVIMDGVGIGAHDETDAVWLARTPNLDRYARTSLATRLRAHGTAVGMPSDDDMGNSEVGHNALGAGRVFAQGAKLVLDAITSGRLFEGETWKRAIAQASSGPDAALHLIGLLSDGNVHSHIDHLLALVARADAEGVRRLFVHTLLDGRDVPKTSALQYVDQLEAALARANQRAGRTYRIASGGGRMQITMDRYEADWPMVARGWATHVRGEGRRFASARQAIEQFREDTPGIIDQDLPAFVIADERDGSQPMGRIASGDAVVLFNFRGDRALELVRAFDDDDFDRFDRGPRPHVFFAGMTLYDGDTGRPQHYLVAPPRIDHTFSELLCRAGVRQLAVSETQKFGHVTYFWNGNRSGTFDDRLETYIEVPSYAPPFDARPEMRAPEITRRVIAELTNDPTYRFARINFANGDMVGHTGNIAATIAAVEAVDMAIGKLEAAVVVSGGALVVTADHGNADDMGERDKKTGAPKRDASGAIVPKTAHSLNPVPFYVVLGDRDRARFRLSPPCGPSPAGLGNVAATLANLLGFEPPAAYLPAIVAPVAC